MDENSFNKLLLYDFVPDEKIYIKDTEIVNKKINEFQTNPNKTVIVTDFDFTLTRRRNLSKDSKRAYFSTFCIPEYSQHISEEFKEEKDRLFRFYHSYEDDLTVDLETRDKMMKTWIEKLLVETTNCKLSTALCRKMIQETTDLKLRHGINDFFETIYKNKIKIYIVSGGLYELINEILIEAVPVYPKLKEEKLITIISNELTYDNKGISVDYKKPIVYTFNKSKLFKDLYKEEKDCNIILMGDHLKDFDIIKEIEYKDCLNIGYYNKDKEGDNTYFDEYEKIFNVLIADGNLNYVVDTLNDIFL